MSQINNVDKFFSKILQIGGIEKKWGDRPSKMEADIIFPRLFS